MEQKNNIIDLFHGMDIENKGWLTKTQAECMWYSTGLLGWTNEKVTQENVKLLYIKCLEKHKRILSLVQGNFSTILHKISSSLSIMDLKQIYEHINKEE